MPANKETGFLTVRPQLIIEDLMEKYGCSVYGYHSVKYPPKRLVECHILDVIPATRKRSKLHR
jgi:hypothetical protein